MKHVEVRQKYSAARRIFNSLLGVSSGDETLRLMFDILLENELTSCVERLTTHESNLSCNKSGFSRFGKLIAESRKN